MFQLGGWIDIRPVGGDPSRTPYSVFALLHYPHRTSLSLSLSLSHFVEFATPQYSLLLLLHFSPEGEGFREGSFRPCISVCMRMGVYEDHSKGGEVIKQFKRISDLILIVWHLLHDFISQLKAGSNCHNGFPSLPPLRNKISIATSIVRPMGTVRQRWFLFHFFAFAGMSSERP